MNTSQGRNLFNPMTYRYKLYDGSDPDPPYQLPLLDGGQLLEPHVVRWVVPETAVKTATVSEADVVHQQLNYRQSCLTDIDRSPL